MTVSRLIEFGFCFLAALVVLTVISFLTLRPTLQELRLEAQGEWESFLRAVNERNESIPGLVEAIKGFEPGHGRLAEELLAARAMAMRARDPDRIVASVEEIERHLAQMERLVEARPDMGEYSPFAVPWRQVADIGRRVKESRNAYNKSARSYNLLLTPFPQNILTTLFGYVPLSPYPV
ncbi:MAG: LemA family protein [Desulfomonilaceae bacterium]|nr:LemA family protein [Desulfomonilaceae bacterium]